MAAVKDVVTDFADSTTAHGYSRLRNASSKVIRVFWTIIILSAVTGLCYHLSHLLIVYLKYEKSTTIHEGLEPITFPKVVICATKQFSHVAAIADPQKRLSNIRGYLREQTRSLLPTATSRTLNRFVDEVLKESIISGHMTELNDYVVQKENLIVYCEYMSVECGPQNFSSISYNGYGECFEFQTPNISNIKASFHRSLQLLLYVEDSLWNDRLEHVMTTNGVLIYTVQDGFYVNFNRLVPVTAATGYLTNIGLKFSKIERINTYNDPCRDNQKIYRLSEKDIVSYPYENHDCVDMEISKQLALRCRCISTQLPISEENRNTSHCLDVTTDANSSVTNLMDLVKKFQCEALELGRLERKVEVNRTICPKACLRREIQREISAVRIPNDKHLEEVYVQDFIRANLSSTLKSNLKTFDRILNATGNGFKPEAVEKNLLQLNVFVRSSEVTTYKETLTYPLVSFFSEAGGVLGLWVGASVVTIVEMLEFLSKVFVHLIKRPENPDKVKKIAFQTSMNELTL